MTIIQVVSGMYIMDKFINSRNQIPLLPFTSLTTILDNIHMYVQRKHLAFITNFCIRSESLESLLCKSIYFHILVVFVMHVAAAGQQVMTHACVNIYLHIVVHLCLWLLIMLICNIKNHRFHQYLNSERHDLITSSLHKCARSVVTT